MHVTVVLPITDPRRLIDPALVLARPNWRTPGEFVRSFGEIEPSVPTDGLVDGCVCAAEKALKIEALPTMTLPDQTAARLGRGSLMMGLATDWPNRRLYHDGRLTGRFEITFTVPSFRSRTARETYERSFDGALLEGGLLPGIVSALAATRVRIGSGGRAWEGALGDAGDAIAEAVGRATAAGNAPVSGRMGEACSSVQPLALVKTLEEPHAAPIAGAEIVAEWASGRLEQLEEVAGLRVLVLRETRRGPQIDAFRAGIARFHAYSESAGMIARAAADGDTDDEDSSIIGTLTTIFDLEDRLARRVGDFGPARANGAAPASLAALAKPALASLTEIWKPPATRRLMPMLKPPPRKSWLWRMLTGPEAYSAFISYRRQDAELVQSIRLALEQGLGKDQVFFDLTCLDPGAEFPNRLVATLRDARAVVVVIGENWLGQRSDQDKMRIELPSDWVRREVEIALAHGKAIVPVLMNRDTFPKSMPPELADLARFNYEPVFSSSRDFDHQVQRVVDAVRRAIDS